MENKLCKLLGIKYPVISGGMVWCSGWRLASAVSNNGGLGLIGAGSMHPETLREHIHKCKDATSKPFGVNVPMLYPELDKIIDIIIEEKVPIVVTSAGNPKTYTQRFHDAGIIVMHVVSSTKFALKAQEAGVDAVIAEGFEAGGHNGRDETTSFALIPGVSQVLSIPLVAAGGMYNGQSLAAALALGADGIQIGTRFALSTESSANNIFKELCRNLKEGDTILTLKQLAPVRLIKNKFCNEILAMEQQGKTTEELRAHLGKGRAKKGIFEGDTDEGELEIGQIASLIKKEEAVKEIFDDIISGYNHTMGMLPKNF
ncbi:2-nitropropane dioxygenase [Porphyromonas macacae]|uniref:2-nitropropane dioxygenase n=1 Tax=Porphyromonas macacae TaxID=28115 RepID=A0A0A2EAH5_9PORP|nr:nitronate monooxygenase [Porphyromonas macacae]KGN74470.1 2-nitropropane dioxygenase [Porphyromonas macacae]